MTRHQVRTVSSIASSRYSVVAKFVIVLSIAVFAGTSISIGVKPYPINAVVLLNEPSLAPSRYDNPCATTLRGGPIGMVIGVFAGAA